MTDLYQQTCEACRADAPRVPVDEAEVMLEEIPLWRIQQQEGVKQLARNFKFKNFVEALAFTNTVANLAEEEGHHPKLVLEWGSVEVVWWTHKIKGLHKNDFVMAAKTDKLYEGQPVRLAS